MTVTQLGKDLEGSSVVISLGYEERKSHIECIGRTGSGKTTFLKNVFLQDIVQGKGGAYFDPDGDAVHEMLNRLEDTKLKYVYWLDPNDDKFPGINPLFCEDITDPKQVIDVASSTLNIFKQIWTNISPEHTPRLETILQLCFITLILNNKTLAKLPALLTDEKLRQEMVRLIPDTYEYKEVRDFWLKEFNIWDQRTKDARTESTLTRVRNFLFNPTVKKIIDHQKTQIDFKTAMDQGHVFLFRLSPYREDGKGGIGIEGCQLIGTMLVSLILKAAMTRNTRNFFSLVVDEFELFASPDFADMLARVRKYGVAVTIGYQYRGQLDDLLRGAVEQTSAKVVCRTTATDAKHFASTFARDAPPAETRQEQVLAITPDPVGWFKQGKPHSNHRVSVLVEKYIKSFLVFLERCDRIQAINVHRYLEAINQLLVNAMHGQIQLNSSDFFKILHAGADPFSGANSYFPKIFRIEEPESMADTMNRILHPSSKDTFVHAYQGKGQFSQDAVERFLYRTRENFLYAIYHQSFPKTQREKEADENFKNSPRVKLLEDKAANEKARQQRRHQMLVNNFINQGKRIPAPFFDEIPYITDYNYQTEDEKWRESLYFQMKEKLYKESLEDQEYINTNPGWIERKKWALEQAQNALDTLMQFISEWDELAQLLSLEENKIKVASGQYEEKAVHQKSPQDLEAEMEKELMRLERGTAWCQFEDYNAPSGQQNKRYKIKIPKELYEDLVYGKVAAKRFEAIKQKTYATYCKEEPRLTIVPEVILEQQPQQPQGRLMPVCKYCGASNAPGSKFCNQCGENLHPDN